MRLYALVKSRDHSNCSDRLTIVQKQITEHRTSTRAGTATACENHKNNFSVQLCVYFRRYLVIVVDNKLFCFLPVFVAALAPGDMVLIFCTAQC